ncbi:Conserved_hypothetical protein [Hexamita inflata]|uniref:Uncharacterized protein n=1 Tax=Hexamita inflata TaxID=28002 RepID=A0AA86R4X2_9EUKA|nr:Conserved hypothetical protein [Hexamita inflata]
MYKIFNCVLNYIFHIQITESVQNNFSLLHDGSKTGKSTFLISIFYTYLFHRDLTATPILVNNVTGSISQKLYYQQNLCLQNDIQQLNNNFYSVFESTNDSDPEYLLALLINANLKDFKNYPNIVNRLAQSIHNHICTITTLKTIIKARYDNEIASTLNYLKQNTDGANLKQQINILNKENSIWQMYQNTTLINLVNFIQYFQFDISAKQNTIQQSQINDIQNLNYSEIEKFFENISKSVSDLNEKPTSGIILIDEISNFSKIIPKYRFELLKLAKYVMINFKSDQFQIKIKKNLQNLLAEDQLKIYQIIFCEIQDLSSEHFLRMLFLAFPMSLFLRDNIIDTMMNPCNDFKMICENQDWDTLTGSIKAKNVFKELFILANIGGFESLAFRDMQNAIYQIQQKYQDKQKEKEVNEKNKCISEESINKQLFIVFNNKQTEKVFKQNLTLFNIESSQLQAQYVFNIICAGTNISLHDIMRYSANLLQTGGSRVIAQRTLYLHFVSLTVPQVHPSLLGGQYYLYGIKSISYNRLIYQQEYEIFNLITDIFQVLQSESSSFIQTICRAVSPQLVITNSDQSLIHPSSLSTFIHLGNQEYILNIINVDQMNDQIAICKQTKEIYNYITYQKQEQNQDIIKIFKSSQFSEVAKFPANQITKCIQLQALSTNNQPVLANAVNHLIISYLNQLKCQSNKVYQDIANIILKNVSLIVSQSQISESMCLLHYLSILYGDYRITYKQEQIMEILKTQFLSNEYYQQLQIINKKTISGYLTMIQTINTFPLLNFYYNDQSQVTQINHLLTYQKELISFIDILNICNDYHNNTGLQMAGKNATISLITSLIKTIHLQNDNFAYICILQQLIKSLSIVKQIIYDSEIYEYHLKLINYDLVEYLNKLKMSLSKISIQTPTIELSSIVTACINESKLIKDLITQINQYVENPLVQNSQSILLEQQGQIVKIVYLYIYNKQQYKEYVQVNTPPFVCQITEITDQITETQINMLKSQYEQVYNEFIQSEPQNIKPTAINFINSQYFNSKVFITVLQAEQLKHTQNGQNNQKQEIYNIYDEYIRQQLDIMVITAQYQITQEYETIIMATSIDHAQFQQNDTQKSCKLNLRSIFSNWNYVQQ